MRISNYGILRMGAVLVAASAGAADVKTILDTTNGASAFVVLDARTNQKVRVGSDGVITVSNTVNRGSGVRTLFTISGAQDIEVGAGANGYFGGVAVGPGANGFAAGAALGGSANGADHGIALGYQAVGTNYGMAVGYQAKGNSFGVAVGYQAIGTNYGVAVGTLANSSHEGTALGYQANGYWYGVAAGYQSDGTISGAALGYQADGSWHGAAVGGLANGNDYGAALGYRAEGTNYGVGVGNNAHGNDHGVAVGYMANGEDYGAAVGRAAEGTNSGAAMGVQANGNNYGSAMGYMSKGEQHGVSIGYYAYGTNYGTAMGDHALGSQYGVAAGAAADGRQGGVALGYGAKGTNYNIAIGYAANARASTCAAIGVDVINDIGNSTRMRGDLYLDGGQFVRYRTTFGSGAWSAKAFLIDHPLDPENQVLRHYCLEGPEVWNVYAGNAQLKNGEVVVELPAYYAALNLAGSEIYSLTPVGDFAELCVRSKVQDNRFVIAGKKDVEVSWTIKVRRNDPACLADLRQRPVEQLKSELDKDRMAAETRSVNTGN